MASSVTFRPRTARARGYRRPALEHTGVRRQLLAADKLGQEHVPVVQRRHGSVTSHRGRSGTVQLRDCRHGRELGPRRVKAYEPTGCCGCGSVYVVCVKTTPQNNLARVEVLKMNGFDS